MEVEKEYGNRLKEVEAWFLVHERDMIMDFASKCLTGTMLFSMEVYTASTLIEKCYNSLADEVKIFLNPVSFLVKWISERGANRFNVGVIECYGEGSTYFKTLEQYPEEERVELLSKISLECVWIVSLLKDNKSVIE